PALLTQQKRKKTNRACNHCHRAHMTCDTNRPCKRCIQRGLDATCEDAPRKRKKYLADVPNSILSLASMEMAPQQPNPAQKGMNELQFPSDSSFGGFNPVKSESMSMPMHPNQRPNAQLPQLPPQLSQLPPPQGLPLPQIPQYNQSPNPSNDPLHRHLKRAPRRTNFLSSAADMEYSTLSSILQDSVGHPGHSTSNEGTPNSFNISPALSPSTMSNSISGNARNPPSDLHFHHKSQISPYFSGSSQTSSPRDPAGRSRSNTSIYDNPRYPKCDESINQYFLGPTETDNVLMFPDVITAIDSIKHNDPAVYNERNSKLTLSFTIGIVPDDSHYTKLGDAQDNEGFFKEPEEIYAKVTKPFSYTPGYHSLIAYLKKRFPKPMLVQMAKSMAAYRPSFIACTNSLKEGDLIFMEQCFQRTLLTYDNFVRVSGTPTIVWRRTGEIAYVGNEFCILTGWSKNELVGQKKFIVELLDDKSVVEYFQLFSRIAFGDFLGATMTECTLLTPKSDVKIRTGCMWTLKRDVFGIPMMIIGNFLPIV
ncbi:uncharacterized protein CANTADRAFT_50969, partial [Suhomyces tanzawaensis NRRL Y-17324]